MQAMRSGVAPNFRSAAVSAQSNSPQRKGIGVMPGIGWRLRAGVGSLVALAVLAAMPATATAQAIYRCERGGRTIYTDAPCDRPVIQRQGNEAPPAKAIESQNIVGGGYENPYGPWRGQAQFQLVQTGYGTERAHAVVPLILEIQEGGKVVGKSPENGCVMLGVASPGFTPKMLTLDVTLSDCDVQGLNRRFSGSIAAYSGKRSAQVFVMASRVGIGTAQTADIKATMRR